MKYEQPQADSYQPQVHPCFQQMRGIRMPSRVHASLFLNPTLAQRGDQLDHGRFYDSQADLAGGGQLSARNHLPTRFIQKWAGSR